MNGLIPGGIRELHGERPGDSRHGAPRRAGERRPEAGAGFADVLGSQPPAEPPREPTPVGNRDEAPRRAGESNPEVASDPAQAPASPPPADPPHDDASTANPGEATIPVSPSALQDGSGPAQALESPPTGVQSRGDTPVPPEDARTETKEASPQPPSAALSNAGEKTSAVAEAARVAAPPDSSSDIPTRPAIRADSLDQGASREASSPERAFSPQANLQPVRHGSRAAAARAPAPMTEPGAASGNRGEAEPPRPAGGAAVAATAYPAAPVVGRPGESRPEPAAQDSTPISRGEPAERSPTPPETPRPAPGNGSEDAPSAPAPTRNADSRSPAPTVSTPDADAGADGQTPRLPQGLQPEAPATPAPSMRGPEGSASAGAFERLEQIGETVRQLAAHAFREGQGQAGSLTMTLHPESLGKLILSCREVGDKMTVFVTTQTEAAREVLHGLRSEVERLAQHEGFRSVQFDVRTDADGGRQNPAWDNREARRETSRQIVPPAGQEASPIPAESGRQSGTNRRISLVA